MGLVKFASANNIIKYDDMSQNASNSAYVLNQWPSSFSLVRSSFSFRRRTDKRAGLCGVTYRKKRYRLKGNINDVANMKDLLVTVFDFPTECIYELTVTWLTQHEGVILDDEINSILVWPLKEGVTLPVIVDACHSGAVLDLSYVYDPEKCTWKDNKPPAREPIRKHPSGGLAICISACEDHQTAAETSALRGKKMNGVMITYGGLME